MNIAMICDPINQQLGGSFISTLRFGELLSKKGHKVIFIAAKYPKMKNIDFHGNIKIYRFTSLVLPKSEKKFYLSFPSSKSLEKVFADEKIEIVHIMLPTPSALIAVKAARKLKLKIVAHSHTQPENIFLHLPKFLQTKTMHNYFYKYLLWIYKKADITICPTKFAEDALKRYDPKLKTIIISNGIDTSKFKNIEKLDFFKKHNLNLHEKHLLFVGRIHPEKSIDTIIKSLPLVLTEFKDVKLLIAGSGYLQYELEKLSRTLNLTNNIIFLGKVSDEDLVLAYNSADIFILPSLAELEGMVVLEAMACSKPILIADSINSASTHFVNGNGFLFKSKDENDLSKKIITLLTNDQLRNDMAKESFEQSKKYDIQKSIELLEEVYSK